MNHHKKTMLQVIEYLKPDEVFVRGEEMLIRGEAEMAGQDDLGYYLAHQDEIPKEYRTKYLVFGGMTEINSAGDRYLAYLSWDGGSWMLNWRRLRGGFSDYGLLVRKSPRKLDPDVLDFLDSLELGIKNLRAKLSGE